MSTSIDAAPPAGTVHQDWNGTPTVLQPNESVWMNATPDGLLVLVLAGPGEVVLTSGGGEPRVITIPRDPPAVVSANFRSQPLHLTNVGDTPVTAAAYGPGLGGPPLELPVGKTVALRPAQSAQGRTPDPRGVLAMNAPSGVQALVALIGGPSTAPASEAFVFLLNAAQNTGPGTGQTPPPGYYATTTRDAYDFPIQWSPAFAYVANGSTTTAGPLVNVTLSALS